MTAVPLTPASVVARYKLRNGFTIQTGAPLADGTHVAVAGRPAGAQACPAATADAAFAKALAQVGEWRE